MFIAIIIGILIYIFIIKPFLRQRQNDNFVSYLTVPDEIKYMINTEKVLELANILVELEIKGEYHLAKIVLEAIDSKGFSFSRRVDKIRNELRIQAGLGPLKNF